MALNTPLARKMGIKYPIFGLAHNIDVMVALGKAGGYPVFGAARSMPDEIAEEARIMKHGWRRHGPGGNEIEPARRPQGLRPEADGKI